MSTQYTSQKIQNSREKTKYPEEKKTKKKIKTSIEGKTESNGMSNPIHTPFA